MRRRPDLKIYLRPAIAIAGEEVLVEAVLTSKSRTPVDAITMTLHGREVAAVANAIVLRRSVVAQRAAFGPRVLERGEHRLTARFPIPPDAPPSYRSLNIVNDYELDVRIEIPWWFDRREKFVLPVTRRAAGEGASAPRVYCNRTRTPDALYMEATLDRDWIEQGSAITGAVSFSNVKSARIKRVELQFRSSQGIGENLEAPTWRIDGASYVSVILDRAPNEGETCRFHVGVPSDAVMSFRAAYCRVDWRAAIVAIVSFGDDVEIEIPIQIVPAGRTRKRQRVELPPVGRERRAAVLQAAARTLEIEFDRESEELKSTSGSTTATIRLEPHEKKGLVAVAELQWPSLSLDFEVRERRWSDAFAEEIEVDPAFNKRFLVRARDRAPAAIVLDDRVRAALTEFVEVEIHDDGATLARPISIQSVETVVDELRPTLEAIHRLADAAARVAPSVGYR